MDIFQVRRNAMVEQQLAARAIHNDKILDAMRNIPRERFVPADLLRHAYEDRPLPIGGGQTISQPYIVALMLEAAAIEPGDRMLEIGVGSGYAAAVASCLCSHVYAIDRDEALADEAKARIMALGYPNISIRAGDGTLGWPQKAPFDVILVSAAAPRLPATLLGQLAPQGRLVIPVGGRGEQRLLRVMRSADGGSHTEDLGGVRFVPLVGADGW